jgi:hypothetical protein
MRRHLLLIFLALCVGLGVRAQAQTAALPEMPAGGTAPLPEGPPPETEEPPAPAPPTTTPILPAQAKRSSLMIRRGERELEWRVAYSHFSKSTVFVDGVAMLPVLVVGEVGIERVRRDLLINSLAVRYGIRDNFEGEVKAPVRFQNERHALPEQDNQEDTLLGFGLGDIEGSLLYQLPHTSTQAVKWVALLQVKSATGRDLFSINRDEDVPLGTGFWSTKTGISGVKISDPAAVYWSFNYTHNWLRENIRVVSEDSETGEQIVSYIDIKPGNTIDFGGGVAYALNPKLSLSAGMSVSFNGSTTANEKDLANTSLTSAALRLGAVWLENRVPVDLSVSIGLTDDSPDFTLEWRNSKKF